MKQILLFLLTLSFNVMACGPSPQKVIQTISIKADSVKVWEMVSDFGAIHTWHPEVVATSLEDRLDENGNPMHSRTLRLINGDFITEKQREPQQKEMKLGAVQIQSDMAVSNYSDVITIKPSLVTGETLVTWTGRFSNKANLMLAPVGQDNAAAIATVEAWYKTGLQGLKATLESSYFVLTR